MRSRTLSRSLPRLPSQSFAGSPLLRQRNHNSFEHNSLIQPQRQKQQLQRQQHEQGRGLMGVQSSVQRRQQQRSQLPLILTASGSSAVPPRPTMPATRSVKKIEMFLVHAFTLNLGLDMHCVCGMQLLSFACTVCGMQLLFACTVVVACSYCPLHALIVWMLLRYKPNQHSNGNPELESYTSCVCVCVCVCV